MQIKLVVNEREVQLSWELVQSVLANVSRDDDSFADVLNELAQSSVASVRRAVANTHVISEETVATLVSDPCPWVIESLVSSHPGKLSQAALIQIIEHKWSMVNRNIAQNVEAYYQSDITVVSKLLADSADPSVRSALASNSSTPKAIVRQLLKDTNYEVRRSAKNTLDTN
jgi:hypothetical protein